MNTDIHPHPLDGELEDAQEFTMPSAEAMLAATLALMTGHVQACCDPHRDRIAERIAANLFYLAQHPVLSEGFKTMLWGLRTRWRVQIDNQAQARQANVSNASQWHTAPSATQ